MMNWGGLARQLGRHVRVLAARISASTSPMVCADTVPPVPRLRVLVLVDDVVAGARERGGFSVNEEVGDVERVQEDRLEHRSRRRNAACRSDWRDMARACHCEIFTTSSHTDRFYFGGQRS